MTIHAKDTCACKQTHTHTHTHTHTNNHRARWRFMWLLGTRTLSYKRLVFNITHTHWLHYFMAGLHSLSGQYTVILPYDQATRAYVHMRELVWGNAMMEWEPEHCPVRDRQPRLATTHHHRALCLVLVDTQATASHQQSCSIEKLLQFWPLMSD